MVGGGDFKLTDPAVAGSAAIALAAAEGLVKSGFALRLASCLHSRLANSEEAQAGFQCHGLSVFTPVR
jgi:hypothetical protein